MLHSQKMKAELVSNISEDLPKTTFCDEAVGKDTEEKNLNLAALPSGEVSCDSKEG